jgi:outer membrane protein assembly factor BamB
MKRLPLILFAGTALLALSSAPVAQAVNTDVVNHDTFAEFSPGEFDNVSLTSEGHLELAPAMTNSADVTDPVIWAAVQDAQGNVFFGTGNQGKVYKLTPTGELSVFFAPNEVMVHALALDGKGRLYAATSPNGRVYRLEADGRAEVFCAPGETYIWAMTFGKDGALYLATGNHGKILRVAPTNSTPAQAATYLETEETHINALAWTRDGNLLAGTSPHGYLYCIDKTNHGFVLFNSGDAEIKQIAVASNGIIYVSTFVGNSKPEASSGSGLIISLMGAGTTSENSSKAGATSNTPPSSPGPTDGGPLGVLGAAMTGGPGLAGMPGKGEPSQGGIYRIDTNGFHERYWTAPDEAIYSMILLPDGNLLAGTGDKGRIYSISDPNHWKLLQKTSDGAQVSALLPDTAESKRYYAATSHPGKLYRLDFTLATNGTYTSKAFDAKQKSFWGKIHPDGDVPDGTGLEFSTRSGNTDKPEKTWSDWSKPAPLGQEISVSNPPARYLQYRVSFKRDAKSPSATAQLQRVRFYYQSQNAAPVISRVKVYTEGFGVSKMPMPQMDLPVNLDQLLGGGVGNGNRPGNSDSLSGGSPGSSAFTPNLLSAMALRPALKLTKSPGLCTMVWMASDPNQDKLTYSVAIRSEAEKTWTTLADKTEDTFLSFDTTGFREGFYFVKVTASDAVSNTAETARTTEETSEAFLIDNTPPVLTIKKQEVEKDRARIIVEAVDNASVISSAAYSLDGKDEVALRPDNLMFDSTNETFAVELTGLGQGAHSLLLRVQNDAKNTSVLKLNFEVK